MENHPIYLAGIERSGTSLMYALLASHPRIAMIRRTYLWMYFNNKYGDLGVEENFERCIAKMSQFKRLRVIGFDPDRLRNEFPDGEKNYARLFSLIGEHFAEKQGKQRWGDKSLNTERYMDDIFASYPNAKIIHMMRDPRDRYASAKTRWVKMRGWAGAGSIMWIDSVRLARRGMKKYPDNYLVVRYEDVVSNPEETMRTVCSFLGEEYAPEMLEMRGAPSHRDKGGNSSYGKREVGVISGGSVARYRKVLSKDDIKFIQDVCKYGMMHFNYPLDDVRLPLKDSISYIFTNIPSNIMRMVLWAAKEIYLEFRGRKLPAHRIVRDIT